MGATTVREKPILFTPENVRAIIDGRKTQTRRIVKPQPIADIDTFLPADPSGFWGFIGDSPTQCIHCPYGEVGDRLWVKEGWRPEVVHSHGQNSCDCGDVEVKYLADGATRFFSDGSIPPEWTIPKAAKRGGVTSLFMPRWASRLTLEITGIRVERLAEISEADAIAEGCQCAGVPASLANRGAYAKLWESINGPGSWAANPFVWVIEFQPTEAR